MKTFNFLATSRLLPILALFSTHNCIPILSPVQPSRKNVPTRFLIACSVKSLYKFTSGLYVIVVKSLYEVTSALYVMVVKSLYKVSSALYVMVSLVSANCTRYFDVHIVEGGVCIPVLGNWRLH